MSKPFDRSNPFNVLLVEDNAGDILLIGQTLLDEPFPTRIRHAMDVKEAVQILAEERFIPDLVILDLNLPGGSGMEFLQRYPSVAPVVVFATSISSQDRQHAIQLGAKDIVEKPAGFQGYIRAVSRIVRTWASPKGIAASSECGS